MLVDAVAVQQLLVAALLLDALLGEHQNLLGVADGGQPVGNDQGGTVFGQPLQALLDQPFALVVQGGGGLVKDEDGGGFSERPGRWTAAASDRRRA